MLRSRTFRMMSAASHYDCRDRMLEDELLLIVGLQHNRVFVERADAAAELYSAHQVDSDGRLIFSSSIEEGVLNILRRLGFHCADLSLIQNQIGTLQHQQSKIEPRLPSWQMKPGMRDSWQHANLRQVALEGA